MAVTQIDRMACHASEAVVSKAFNLNGGVKSKISNTFVHCMNRHAYFCYITEINVTR